MKLSRLAALFVLAAGISFVLSSAVMAHPAKKTAVQHITLVVKSDTEHGKKGPDGKWHDAFLPANFKVHRGAKVVVTVINHDDGAHSFTSPALHVNAVIVGGKDIEAAKEGAEKIKPSKTTFSFIAKKRGRFAWHCALPCDPWAMTHVGYMKGFVIVR
jgi:uncharacterized cupredoxin-like copper-binding protein